MPHSESIGDVDEYSELSVDRATLDSLDWSSHLGLYDREMSFLLTEDGKNKWDRSRNQRSAT